MIILIKLIISISGIGMINLILFTMWVNYATDKAKNAKDKEFFQESSEIWRTLPMLIRRGSILQFLKLLFMSAIEIPMIVLLATYRSITSKGGKKW